MMPMPTAPKADPIVPVPGGTLTYEQSSALMTDFNFKGRVKTACLKFAKYIMEEQPSTQAHNSRMRWAQQCYLNPESVAMQTQPPTVMNDAVQQQGSEISDGDLQTAVETVVQALM